MYKNVYMYIVPVRVIIRTSEIDVIWHADMNLIQFLRSISGRWRIYFEASGLSSRPAFVLLCDGGIDRILNGGRRLVMVSVWRSSQKRLGYDCIFYKNIQCFWKMCLRMVVTLRCCIENLRFLVSRCVLRVAGRQTVVNSDCRSWLCSDNIYTSTKGVF